MKATKKQKAKALKQLKRIKDWAMEGVDMAMGCSNPESYPEIEAIRKSLLKSYRKIRKSLLVK